MACLIGQAVPMPSLGRKLAKVRRVRVRNGVYYRFRRLTVSDTRAEILWLCLTVLGHSDRLLNEFDANSTGSLHQALKTPGRNLASSRVPGVSGETLLFADVGIYAYSLGILALELAVC